MLKKDLVIAFISLVLLTVSIWFYFEFQSSSQENIIAQEIKHYHRYVKDAKLHPYDMNYSFQIVNQKILAFEKFIEKNEGDFSESDFKEIESLNKHFLNLILKSLDFTTIKGLFDGYFISPLNNFSFFPIKGESLEQIISILKTRHPNTSKLLLKYFLEEENQDKFNNDFIIADSVLLSYFYIDQSQKMVRVYSQYK